MAPRDLRLLAVTGVTILCASCVPYKPVLHLENSRATIAARAYLEPLRDLSPPEAHEDGPDQSLEQTNVTAMEGDLSTFVTSAIEAEFSATSVFQSIEEDRLHADLILSGVIHQFHGRVSMPGWLRIPGVSLAVQTFWGIVQEWEGVVDLELTVVTPRGTVLGTYRGRAAYDEVVRYDHRYWAMPLYPAHARLNAAFTEAVRQIREQMLKDRARLTASAGR